MKAALDALEAEWLAVGADLRTNAAAQREQILAEAAALADEL